eukprot:2123412-Rhodomonas_salina.1
MEWGKKQRAPHLSITKEINHYDQNLTQNQVGASWPVPKSQPPMVPKLELHKALAVSQSQKPVRREEPE